MKTGRRLELSAVYLDEIKQCELSEISISTAKKGERVGPMAQSDLVHSLLVISSSSSS